MTFFPTCCLFGYCENTGTGTNKNCDSRDHAMDPFVKKESEFKSSFYFLVLLYEKSEDYLGNCGR